MPWYARALVSTPPPDGTREAVEGRTQSWLGASLLDSMRTLRGREAGVYDPSGRPHAMTAFHFQEVLRKLKIFRWLDQQRFESFLDVGSGFDIYPKLVAARYGVPAYFSDLTHRMNLPYGGDVFGKLDHAVTLNLLRLPFPDDAFEVVLASEVLEHLVRPIEAIAELFRVTRRWLVMTSLEALAANSRERRRAHRRVDVRVPHVERNFLLLEEFDAIFGPGYHHENLFHDATLPASMFASDAEQAAAYGAIGSASEFADALVRALAVDDHRPGAMGILLVKPMPGTGLTVPRPADDASLARWLIDRTAWFERTLLEITRRHDGPGDFARPDRPVDDGLLARLRCPDCRARLARADLGVVCSGCGAVFPSEYGVPILYPSRPPDPATTEAETLRRVCAADVAHRRVVERLMQRLRQNECAPGRLRRVAWKVQDGLARFRTRG
jgi:SAM-dependent methyltransferase